MNLFENINYKSLIYGIIISIVCVVLGYRTNDLFYPFTAIGLLYVGYCANDIKQGIIVGMITAIPIAILSLFGYLGTFNFISNYRFLIICQNKETGQSFPQNLVINLFLVTFKTMLFIF